MFVLILSLSPFSLYYIILLFTQNWKIHFQKFNIKEINLFKNSAICQEQSN